MAMTKCSDSVSCRLDKVYLIVYIVTDDIKGTKLPSSKQVLGFFLRLHRHQGKTLHIPATRSIAKLAEFRNKEKIPVRDKQHFIRKVEDVFTKKEGAEKESQMSNRDLIEKKRIISRSAFRICLIYNMLNLFHLLKLMKISNS